eukprot:83571_1
MGFCIAAANQKPFLILVPGLYIQFWISLFISTANNEKKDNAQANTTDIDTRNNDEKKKSTCKTKIISVAKEALKIYQICILIIVFVLDLLYFIDYLNSSNHTNWQNFNCLVEIVVTSSNWKRGLIASAVVTERYTRQYRPKSMFDATSIAPENIDPRDPEANMQQTVKQVNQSKNDEQQLNHAIQVDGGQMHETKDEAKQTTVAQNTRTRHRKTDAVAWLQIFRINLIQEDVLTAKRIRDNDGILMAIYFVLLRILFALMSTCCVFTHAMPGVICYFWVVCIFIFTWALLIWISGICCKCGLCEKMEYCDYDTFVNICGLKLRGRNADNNAGDCEAKKKSK